MLNIVKIQNSKSFIYTLITDGCDMHAPPLATIE